MKEGIIIEQVRGVIDELQTRGNYTCFAYEDIRTGYYSDESGAASWVQSFFDGYFLTSSEPECHATLYSSSERRLFVALQAFCSQHPLLDQHGYLDLPFGGATLIYMQATKVTPVEDVFYLLFREKREIMLVTSSNPLVQQEKSMQMLRTLIKWLLIEKGWIPMHSACVAKDGQAICVSGKKGAGKTSTLLNLLARNDCDLVANDKFLMRDAGTHVAICGIPGKSSIRIGSFVMHPQLQRWLAEKGDPFFPHLSAQEVHRIAQTNTPEQLSKRKEKIDLLPSEVVRQFGRSITSRTQLSLVLLPIFDVSVEESRLIPSPKEETMAVLKASYSSLLRKNEGFLLHFFDLHDEVLQDRLDHLLDKHLSTVPTYDLYQNHRTTEQSTRQIAHVFR